MRWMIGLALSLAAVASAPMAAAQIAIPDQCLGLEGTTLRDCIREQRRLLREQQQQQQQQQQTPSPAEPPPAAARSGQQETEQQRGNRRRRVEEQNNWPQQQQGDVRQEEPTSPANPDPNRGALAVRRPQAPAQTSPGAPSGPGQRIAGARVTLSWAPVLNATEYDLGVRDLTDNSFVVNQRVRGSNFVAALTPGRQYRWNVAACNEAGCSSFTTPLYINTLSEAPTADQGQSPTIPASPGRTYSDDYPYGSAATNSVDPWSFYFRECTSYVAWRMNRDAGTRSSPYFFHNTMGGGRWSDAGNWEDNARALGYTVDASPSRGAIAHWRASEIGSVGHVAYVERVNSDGTVDVSEYNFPRGHSFGVRNGVRAPRYIHVDRREITQVTPPPTFVPVPTSPTPGQTSSPGPTTPSTSVRLSWGGASGAAYYDLGVRDLTTNTLAVDERVNGTSFTANLTAGRRYRWNVRACTTNNACSSFTTPLHFATPSATAPTPPPTTPPPSAGAPATPTGASPGSAGAPGQTTSGTSVRLGWNVSPGATHYDLGVRDLTSNQLVESRQVNGTSFSANLAAGRQYRWNVAACNASGCSSFTAPLYFSTPNASPPPTTTGGSRPATPGNPSPGSSSGPGQTTSNASVRLSWNSVSGATSYDLGVRDMTNDRLVEDRRVNGTSFTANLSEGRRYRWNVAACNDAGCSSFTAPLYFTTPGGGAAARPSTPTGASPGSTSSPGPTTGSRSVQLNWNSVPGATYYDLGVRDMTTNSLVEDRHVNGSSFTANLVAGRRYRWNVAACNDAGCSGFTTPRYFTTP